MSNDITTSKILKINIDIENGYAKIELDSDQSSVERGQSREIGWECRVILVNSFDKTT